MDSFVEKNCAWDESGQPMRMLGTHVINDRKRAEASILKSATTWHEIHDTLAQRLQVLSFASASNR